MNLIGYHIQQVSPNLRVSVGYWALWWLNAIRPGEQVDTLVNPALIPPATVPGAGSHPTLISQSSNLWVQALTFNLEFRY